MIVMGVSDIPGVLAELGPMAEALAYTAIGVVMGLTTAVGALWKNNKEQQQKLERIIEDNLLVMTGQQNVMSELKDVIKSENRVVQSKIESVVTSVDNGMDKIQTAINHLKSSGV